MKSGLMGILWLTERFTATWLDRAGQVATWTAPDSVGDSKELRAALRQARVQAGSSMRRVVFLLDQRNLLFHVQETPPASGKLLGSILDRLVTESRFFDEPATWIRLALPGPPQRHRWLLALMPRSVLDDIEAACQETQLDLVGVHPVASVLATFLARVALTPFETVLLVTDIGSSHNLLVARCDGQVLFARSIALSGAGTDLRLEQEINRTLHFSQQRCGALVTRVVALGAACHATLSGKSLREGLPVECLPGALEGHALEIAVLQLRDDSPLNLARPTRRLPFWARSAVVAGLAALVLVSLVVTVTACFDIRNDAGAALQINRARQAEAGVAANRQIRARRAHDLAALIQAIGRPDDPGVAVTFARHVSRTLPTSLRLTHLEVRKGTNGWAVDLRGVSRLRGSRFLAALDQFERGLSDGLFKVRVADSTHRETLGGVTTSSPTLLSRPAVRDAASDELPFFVRGWIP